MFQELYADIFSSTYGLETIGLRYFNVFGRKQDPNGAYAAVIPKWIKAMINQESVKIFGDGKTSRDFCYIDNVIQMNILAALSNKEDSFGKAYNCACSDQTDLNTLFSLIKNKLVDLDFPVKNSEPQYEDFRPGDIRHSHAEITQAKNHFGYLPTFSAKEGLNDSIEWYIRNI